MRPAKLGRGLTLIAFVCLSITIFRNFAKVQLHGKWLAFVEVEGELDGDYEAQADIFARDLLISSSQASQLKTLPHTKLAVAKFAQKIGIAPGIVVGRMQKERLLDWSYLNGLKIFYRWDHEK